MTKQFLTPIDMNGNEILDLRLQNLGTAPSTPTEGWFYGNSSTHKPMYWNGTAWLDLSSAIIAALSGDISTDGTSNVTSIGAGKVTNAHLAGSIALSKLAQDPLARANHTGTQTAATISGFDTQVRSSRLDQMAAPTSPVSAGSQRITSVADPQVATDAVNLQTLQAQASGLKDPKESCRAATTANIALTGLQTIDGKVLVDNDRVLVWKQTNAAENGIYDAHSVAWTRSADANTSPNVTCGLYTYVEDGTANGGGQFTLTTVNPIVLGTTLLTIVKSNGGAALTQGTGIGITGNQISVLGGLADVYGLARTANNFLMANGSNWVLQTAAQVKTTLGMGNVENTALTTWGGSGNITSLGTIATGVWSGTAILVAKGGTGLTAAVAGGVPYGSSTSAMAFCAAGTAGRPLLSGGAGAPSFGTLTVGGGGTGLTDVTQGGLLWASSTSALTCMAAGTAGQILKSGGTSAPTWSSYKYAADVGNGSLTTIPIPHNLNSQDVIVRVYRKLTPFDEVECDIEHTDVNNVTLKFAVAPTAAQYRVVVLG